MFFNIIYHSWLSFRFSSDSSNADGGDGSGGAKFSYVPFGAGRHRCIGESFAYVQNKTIWSVILEQYELSLPPEGEFPEPNYAGMIHTPVSSIVRYTRRRATTTPKQ